MLEDLQTKLEEAFHQPFVLALNDEQRGGGGGAELDAEDSAASGQPIEQPRPGKAQFLLEIGDELRETAGVGGIEQLTNRSQLPQLLERVQRRQRFDEAARLRHLNQQIGLIGQQSQRRGGRLGTHGRNAEDQDKQTAGDRSKMAHGRALLYNTTSRRTTGGR